MQRDYYNKLTRYSLFPQSRSSYSSQSLTCLCLCMRRRNDHHHHHHGTNWYNATATYLLQRKKKIKKEKKYIHSHQLILSELLLLESLCIVQQVYLSVLRILAQCSATTYLRVIYNTFDLRQVFSKKDTAQAEIYNELVAAGQCGDGICGRL